MIKHRTHRSAAALPTAPPAPGAVAPAEAVPTSDEPKPEAKPDRSEAKGGGLGAQIGHKLKTMFESVVAEPVPEKFRQLLEALERKSGKP